MDLADRTLRVWRVMENAPRVHEIERVGRERQRLGVGNERARVQAIMRQTLPNHFDRRCGEINANRTSACSYEVHEVTSKAGSDLEDSTAAPGREGRELVDKRLRRV